MIAMLIVEFVNLFVLVFNFLLIIRIIASYIAKPDSGFYGTLLNLTEPVVAPVRNVLPKLPGLDLGPLAVFFLLQGVQYLVNAVFGG